MHLLILVCLFLLTVLLHHRLRWWQRPYLQLQSTTGLELNGLSILPTQTAVGPQGGHSAESADGPSRLPQDRGDVQPPAPGPTGHDGGKDHIANVLQDAQAGVLKTRQRLKHRRPRPMPCNVLWAIDLTYVPVAHEKRTILGLLDHCTRACLALRTLPTKSAIVLLRALLDVVEQCGKPKALRTDTEAVFTSRLFQLGLWILGIRHQTTAPFAPWQNGRIERFFGTFKKRLRCRGAGWGLEQELADDLHIYRNWYNHVRPHQHLDGRTPASAWNRKNREWSRKQPKYVCEWEGVLTGFHFPT